MLTNVENGAETTATQLGEVVNPEHLDVVFGAALAGQPLLQLHHLHILKTDTGIDIAFDDGL